MKKRSLLAAVAMLVVSAILLTGSTYAWFTAQHAASVALVKGGVSGVENGNVLVKSATKDWSTSLAASDLYSGDKTFTPVDIDPTGGSWSTIQSADFDTVNYEVNSNAGQGGMLVYTWQVKAVNAGSGNIIIPVTFTSGSFGYGLIEIDGTLASDGTNTYIWGPQSGSYTALGTVTKATDGSTGTAGIIETGEPTNGSLGNSVAVNPPASGELTVSASAVHTIKVIVWAEGQDSDCVGSGSISNVGFEFTNIHIG